MAVSKRPQIITTTEAKRVLLAAKAAGATEVEIRGLHAIYVVRVKDSPPLDEEREIIL